MKQYMRVIGFSALLGLSLLASGASASSKMTLALGSSTQIPGAEGKVQLRHTVNGNIEIRLAVKHLAPPGRIVPGSNVFVVWARGLAPGAEAQNLGALIVDKNLNGKLKAVTAMPAFDLFITCEQGQTVPSPTGPELLPVNYTSK